MSGKFSNAKKPNSPCPKFLYRELIFTCYDELFPVAKTVIFSANAVSINDFKEDCAPTRQFLAQIEIVENFPLPVELNESRVTIPRHQMGFFKYWVSVGTCLKNFSVFIARAWADNNTDRIENSSFVDATRNQPRYSRQIPKLRIVFYNESSSTSWSQEEQNRVRKEIMTVLRRCRVVVGELLTETVDSEPKYYPYKYT